MTEIFVFGSNLAGRHGKGSALEARLNYGAIPGQGRGLQGQSFAIPTKDEKLHRLPIKEIGMHVYDFIKHVNYHPKDTFKVVDIGCGLAGYKPEQIAPLFYGAPPNVEFLGKLKDLVQR